MTHNPLNAATKSEIEALPPSPLRTAALAAFHIEHQADRTCGWDRVPVTVVQILTTRQRKPRTETVPIILGNGGTVAGLIGQFATTLNNSPDVLARFIQSNMDYLGLVVMHEAFLHSVVPIPGVTPDQVGDRVEMRFAAAVIADGTSFVLMRPRGHGPIVSSSTDSRTFGVGGAVAPSLNRLHLTFARAYHPDRDFTVPEPPDGG